VSQNLLWKVIKQEIFPSKLSVISNLPFSGEITVSNRDEIIKKFYEGKRKQRKGNLDESLVIFDALKEKYASSELAKGLALLGKVGIHYRRMALSKAESTAEKALSIFQRLSEHDFIIKTKNTLGLIYLERGEYVRASEIFLSAIQLLEHEENSEDLTIAYNNYGYCLFLQGSYDEAKKFYQQGLKIAIEYNFVHTEISFYENLVLLARRKGEYRDAKILLSQALDKAKKRDNLYFILNIYHDMGSIAMDQGDYEVALNYLGLAKRFARKIKINKRLAQVYADLGTIYHKKFDLNKSLAYFKQSIKLYEDLQITDDIVEKLCEYAEALSSAGDLPGAYQSLDKAAIYAIKHDSQADYSHLSFRMGLLQLHRDRYGLAEYYFKSTLRHLKAANLGTILIRTLTSLACLSIISDNPDGLSKASAYIEDAYIAAKEKNLFPLVVEIQLIQSLLLVFDKKYNKAEKILNNSLKISKEKEFTLDILRIENKLKKIKSQKILEDAYNKEKDDTIVDLITKQDVLYELKRLSYNQEEAIAAQEPLKVEDTFIFVVKQTKDGPSVQTASNIPENVTIPIETFSKMSIIYTMALGSGSNYHEGIFGPFPFDKANLFNSLVYGSRIADPELEDERMNKKNFILICLVYPIKYKHRTYDIGNMERMVKKYLNEHSLISDVTNDSLIKLQNDLINQFQ
jgi:tetratricopeptide (TPR) repeat protein